MDLFLYFYNRHEILVFLLQNQNKYITVQTSGSDENHTRSPENFWWVPTCIRILHFDFFFSPAIFICFVGCNKCTTKIKTWDFDANTEKKRINDVESSPNQGVRRDIWQILRWILSDCIHDHESRTSIRRSGRWKKKWRWTLQKNRNILRLIN